MEPDPETGCYDMGARRRVAMSLRKVVRELKDLEGPEGALNMQLISMARIPIIKARGTWV